MAINESSVLDLEKAVVTCVNCKELQNLVNYCVTCRTDCCIDCTNNSHENHNILPSDHSIVKHIKLFSADDCTLHDKKWSMYCVTCYTPCCLLCIDESHDDHSFKTLKSITNKTESMYAKLIDALPKARSRYDRMKIQYNEYCQSMDATIIGLECQFEKLRMRIDEMETAMIYPLKKEVEEVQKIHFDHGQLLLVGECLVDLYKAALEEGKELPKVNVFSNYPSFERLESELETYPAACLFEPTQNILQTEDMIGSVMRTSDKPSNDQLSRNISIETQMLEIISLKSVDGNAIDGRIVKVHDGTRWVISNPMFTCNELGINGICYSKLSVMDNAHQTNYVLPIDDGSFTDKTDVSIVPPSDLLYTDSKNKKIWRVNTSGSRHLFMSMDPEIPRGVCFTNGGRLAVGLQITRENRRDLIRIYQLDDLKPLNEIERDEHGEPLFTSINSIIENINGELIVQDSSQFICFSEKGSLNWKLNNLNQFCCDKFCSYV